MKYQRLLKAFETYLANHALEAGLVKSQLVVGGSNIGCNCFVRAPSSLACFL